MPEPTETTDSAPKPSYVPGLFSVVVLGAVALLVVGTALAHLAVQLVEVIWRAT